jgi:hypothetical protein
MKKLALATAIATAFTLSGNAHAVIGSDIVSIAMWMPNKATGVNVLVGCGVPKQGFFTRLALTGSVAGTVALRGNVCLDPAYTGMGPNVGAPYLALDFELTDTSNTAGAGGITFNGGGITIWTDWGTTSGWILYSVINAAITNIPCLVAGGNGGLPLLGGVNAIPTAGANAGPTCTANVLGNPVELWLTGNIVD